MDSHETESFLMDAEDRMLGNESLTGHMTDRQAQVLYEECLVALEHAARVLPSREKALEASLALFRLCRAVDLWIESVGSGDSLSSIASAAAATDAAAEAEATAEAEAAAEAAEKCRRLALSPELPLPSGWLDRLGSRLMAVRASHTS